MPVYRQYRRLQSPHKTPTGRRPPSRRGLRRQSGNTRPRGDRSCIATALPFPAPDGISRLISTKKINQHIFEYTPENQNNNDQTKHNKQANTQTETLFGYDRSKLINQPVEM